MGHEESVSDAARRRLRITLIMASLYDLTFAVVNMATPEWGSEFLEIPLPADQVYLRFTGVFLLMAAMFYMLPVLHPGRYLGNVVVAIVGRTLGAVFLVTASLKFGHPFAFILLGAGDFAFALLHFFYLARAEGGNPFRHYFTA